MHRPLLLHLDELQENAAVVTGPFPCDGLAELFHPINQVELGVAMKICDSCRVAELCRANAEAMQETGVWGGQYYLDGRKIKAERVFGGPRSVRTMSVDEAFEDKVS